MSPMENPFLKEIAPLYQQLSRDGMWVRTVEELYLTFEGLLRAMNTAEVPIFKTESREQGGRDFNVFCANHFIPLMLRTEEDTKKEFFVIGIVSHDSQGNVRAYDAVTIKLDDILTMAFGTNRQDERFQYIFITPEQAKELLGEDLVFNERSRFKYLKGIDEDTTAMESFSAILKFARSDRATDIHINPGPKPRIEYRIDGIMHTGKYDLVPDNIRRLTALIKHKAGLKIDEHMIPQGGGITFSEEDLENNPLLQDCSLRVSTMPTVHDARKYGEKIVLRVLHSKVENYDIEKIGMSPEAQAVIKRKIREPKGVILVTGPTGSGKTTSLYAMLMKINDGTRNITTLEDPVEVVIDRITQTPINEAVGMTFAAGLKAILRQDPDVILVGEIRDKEEASIAFSASNTGHLVFATVHTDDSISTLLRLQYLGIDGVNIAPNLKMVISQRLIRQTCLQCLEEYDASDDLVRRLGGKFVKPADHLSGEPMETETILHRAKLGVMSCRHCNGVGYHGRLLLMEHWIITEIEQQMILDGVKNYNAYMEAAISHGFKPMIYSAIDAFLDGDTDLAELARSAITEREFFRYGPKIGEMIYRHMTRVTEARPRT